MKLTAREKYSYGVGALGKDLVCAIVFTYLMVYFTDTVGLSSVFVGGLFLVARIWDAVNDPMMGKIVDNTRSKWGKFRPWILIGAIINSITLVMLFTKPDLQGAKLYIYFSVAYLLWGMTYTIIDIPFWSMLPSLSRDKEEREKVAAIPRIFASIAWLIVGTFGLSIVSKLGNGDAVQGWSRFAMIIAVVFVICSLITVLFVKEKTVTPPSAEKVTLKQTFNIIRRNDQLLVFIGVILTFNLAMQLSGGMAIYYFKYVIGNENLFPIFTAFAGLAEIAGLMLFPILSKKIGRRKVYAIACALPVIGFAMLLVAGFILPQNAVLVAVSGIVLKMGSGFALGLSTVMLADVVDYGEFKLGSRNESIVFSVQTLLVKGASAISGWLVGVGLALIGYVANVQQTVFTMMGMRVLMIVIPAIMAVVSFIIYKKYFLLNGRFYDDILKVLNNRKDKENEASEGNIA